MKDLWKAYGVAWMTAEQLDWLGSVFCSTFSECIGCPFYDEEHPNDCGIVGPQLRLERFVHNMDYRCTIERHP